VTVRRFERPSITASGYVGVIMASNVDGEPMLNDSVTESPSRKTPAPGVAAAGVAVDVTAMLDVKASPAPTSASAPIRRLYRVMKWEGYSA
jgi:hypothetical protein